MNGSPETPQQQPKPDEQLKPGEHATPAKQQKQDETPPPKPKWVADPRYWVDLTEKEAGRGFGIVGARGPRTPRKSD